MDNLWILNIFYLVRAKINNKMRDSEIIKEKLDIVDIIGEYVPLKKTGHNYKALSPFRTEKTPSLVVSPDRQIFRDFGGDKGGDIFTFIMEIENISFQEALEHLAEKAGVKLTKKAPTTKEDKEKDTIYAVNHLTQQFYNFILSKHTAGKKALRYITEERRLPQPLINTFGIGYAPNSTALTKYLTGKKGFSINDLEKAGVVTRYGNRTVDFFRHRIIFPIHDLRGNIVAFSGRALDNNAQPKYINTRETIVYKKSQSLYGLYQAKDDIRKEKKVIVVEGELDVLSPRKEGVKNIVAAKGTALTEDHIRILKRYAEKIVFCFDQDPAGTDAQRRALEIIEKHGLSSSVITLEGGKDPDELVNTNPHVFKKSIKNEINIYDFIIDSAVIEFNPSTADGKRKILAKVLPMLAPLENEVVKEHYLKKLATQLDTTLSSIVKETEKRTSSPKRVEKAQSKKETIEEYLTSLIVQAQNSKKAASISKSIHPHITHQNPGINKLIDILEEKDGKADEIAKNLPKELIPIFDDAYLRPIPEFSTQIELEKEIIKTTHLAKRNSAKKRLEEIAKELKDEKDEKRQEMLAKEYTKLSEVLK